MESPQTGEIVFTRPKEGISDFLSPVIRPHDFRYSLTGDVNNLFDVVGRFIESWISMRALHEMKSTIQSFADNINPDIDYCLGYKVTAHHKHSKTYDSRFEILVRKGNEDKYTTFNGEFLNGQLHYVSANDEIVTWRMSSGFNMWEEVIWILMLFLFGISLALFINYRWSKCKTDRKKKPGS